jgi:hypothetical protein
MYELDVRITIFLVAAYGLALMFWGSVSSPTFNLPFMPTMFSYLKVELFDCRADRRDSPFRDFERAPDPSKFAIHEVHR